MQTLRDNPSLPALVRTLAPAVLKRLIEHVGLRDAGELIALTDTRQLREIFEESLWQTLAPGQAETPRPEVFLQWLDVMLEAGPTFAAERLIELGDTFVVLHLAPLVRVREFHPFDDGANPEKRDEPAEPELIGEYLVCPEHEDEWDTVRAVLLELDGEDAEFTRRVLARCCRRATVRGYGDDQQSLLHDEAHTREQRRERRGFVTPVMASLFLKMARDAALDDLVSERAYDAVAEPYFRPAAQPGGARPNGYAGESTAALGDADDDAGDADDAQVAVPLMHRRALEQALIDAEVITDESAPRLPGPAAPAGLEIGRGTAAADEAVLELQLHLDRLQHRRPDLFSARLAELVFLANVLMAGSWYQGQRFTEPEAAHAALACANLGLDYLERRGNGERDAALLEAPGLVRLFRIGWQLLQALPRRCALALTATLRAGHVREQFAHKRWILEEVDSALHHPELTLLIELGEFEEAAESLVLLALVLDARAHHCLRVLIADFPRYPRQLDAGFERATLTTRSSRFLKSMHDLSRIDDLLDNLDTLLKL
jgi:hypothetical protein